MIEIDSIIGSTTQFGRYGAVIPKVSGSALITGRSEYYFDPDDRSRRRFIFR